MLVLRTAPEIWQMLNTVFFKSWYFNVFNIEINLAKVYKTIMVFYCEKGVKSFSKCQ